MVCCQDGCTGFIKPFLRFKSDAYDAHNGIFSSIILGKSDIASNSYAGKLDYPHSRELINFEKAVSVRRHTESCRDAHLCAVRGPEQVRHSRRHTRYPWRIDEACPRWTHRSRCQD